MTEAKELRIPLINPNETEAVLIKLNVIDGQKVNPGDVIYILETTKSTNEVAVDEAGYVLSIQASEGDTLSVGDLFAYLAENKDWQPPEPETQPAKVDGEMEAPDGLRITDPALALARKNNLDLARLPIGPLVTKAVVNDQLGLSVGLQDIPEGDFDFDPTAIVVYGGGGHGKSVIELLLALKIYKVVGIIDDGLEAGESVLDYQVLGGSEFLPKLHADGIRLAVNAVGGIGSPSSRVAVFNTLAKVGFACPVVVHPTAFVEPSAVLSPGVQVFPFAYVGSDVKLGYGCIINTHSVVSHDCLLGDYVNISPGALIAGGVEIGAMSLIGMGVTVNLNVKIGERSQVGNSAALKSDLHAGGIVRAGSVWPE